MIKRIYILIITFGIIIFTANISLADGKQPPPPSKKSKSFSKGKFSKSSSWNKDGGNVKGIGPPGPGGGDGGNPVPISGGLSFLLIGSAIYFGKKIRDENR